MGQATASGTTYAHADGLGSIRLLTDGSGTVVGQQSYDAYGASRAQSGVQLPFGFTAEQTDAESGLIYLRARYHDPATGRSLSRDSFGGGAGAPLSQQRYGYAQADPTNLVDSTGHTAATADQGGSVFDAHSLSNGVQEFATASWADRIAWVQAVQAQYGLGGWFNNVVGILQYFEWSPTFQNSDRVKCADARVLYAIEEGLASEKLGLNLSSLGTDARQAAEDWKQFFDLLLVRKGADSDLRHVWGIAEEAGVQFGNACPVAVKTAFEDGLYQTFVWIGDRYRDAVTSGKSVWGPLPHPADPRQDQDWVRDRAEFTETTLWNYTQLSQYPASQ